MSEKFNEFRHDHDTGGELNIWDLLIVILKHKWIILSITFVAGILIFILSGSPGSPPPKSIYRSDCTITSSKTDLGIIQEILKSLIFMDEFVNKSDLMPALYPDLWNEKEKKWLIQKPPTMDDAVTLLQSELSANLPEHGNILRLSFSHTNAAAAQKVLNFYVEQLNVFLQKKTSEDYKKKVKVINERRKMLNQEINNTRNTDLKKGLSSILADYIRQEKELITSSLSKGIEVIRPPSKPERIEMPVQKFKFNALMRILLSFIPALILGIFLAFFIESVKNLRIKYPERFKKLREYLKFP